MAVFVLDKRKKPLMPCSEKRARLLLQRGKAVVHKMEPFTIRLKERTLEESETQPLRLKIDPGSKTTGVAVVRDEKNVVALGEIQHKTTIKDDLKSRRDSRRSRRTRKLRYRKKRFENRATKIRDCKICGKNTPKRRKKNGKPAGGRESLCTPCRKKTAKPEKVLERTKKLPPSLQARSNQTINAVKKLQNLMPISHISFEFAKFDTQLLVHEDIAGVEYQQGTLKGYTVREYLLEKWGRRCAYCEDDEVPLEIEHVLAKSKGGTDRIDNLAIACRPCNEEKDDKSLEAWKKELSKKKTKRAKTIVKNIQKVEGQLEKSLKDAAMMNSTRLMILDNLKKRNLPVETGTGALTKMQRIQHDLPKEHYCDALCVGKSTPEKLNFQTNYAFVWKANGRGNRQMARVDKYGLPLRHLDKQKYDKNGKRKGHRERKKTFAGFQTGDIAIADVTKGKKKGFYKGRIAIRHNGYFNIRDIYTDELVQGLSYKYFELIQRNDGWEYTKKKIS